MKKLVKSMWVLVVLPLVCVIAVFLFNQKTQQQYGYFTGPVDTQVLANVMGGGSESISGCYRKINPDCGGVGGNSDRLCPAFASSCGNKVVYYSIHESRSKGLFEQSNTLQGYTLTNQKCYESKACLAQEIENSKYNGNSSNPACVNQPGMVCYSCSNPDMNNPTINQKSDYRCNDP